jgi:predicted nucleic acid-binding protein
MSLVVDASVLVAAAIDTGANGRWAESLLVDQVLLAPHLLPVEVCNVLRRLEASGKLDRLEAASALADCNALEIELLPFAPFAERIWSLRANLSAYDAWYVAIAERFSAECATLDSRLARANGPTCRFVLPT